MEFDRGSRSNRPFVRSEQLLDFFIELNNRVINRFTAGERAHIGVHTCPGGDWDSTHSLDVPYDHLLKEMFKLVSPTISSSASTSIDFCGSFRTLDTF